ncbi:MAG: response regulator [Thermodesulfobacteriota bacterium]
MRQPAFSILVVDDTPEMIDSLGEILKDYHVRAAVNGERALNIAAGSNPPDLILLDIVMPGMDGYEICRRLKADEKTRYIPVIFVSSLSEEGDEAKGLELGALDYIRKPFKPSLVKARVRNHLELKYHQDRLECLVKERTREIVMRLVLATESRDLVTGMHVRRIREYTHLMVMRSGFPEEEAELIGMASTMHDIGKIGIPDEILRKESHLDEGEWTIMKTHPRLGERNLRGSTSRLLEMARLIALTHHERWDGSGYPMGLRGTEIPFAGRVVHIVDVFDALISRRPYKPPLPLGEAFEAIRRGRGTHFDPQLTDLFFDCRREVETVYRKYPDDHCVDGESLQGDPT